MRPRRDIAVPPSSCRNEPFLASLLRGPPACIMVLRQKQPVPPAWGTVGKVSEVTPNGWVFFIFWGALSSHAVSHVPVEGVPPAQDRSASQPLRVRRARKEHLPNVATALRMVILC